MNTSLIPAFGEWLTLMVMFETAIALFFLIIILAKKAWRDG